MSSNHRYLCVEPWEAAAMMAGAMTQKRLPKSHWLAEPKPGALIWVQEPFAEFEDRYHPTRNGMSYHADYPGPMPCIRPPERIAKFRLRLTYREADRMLRKQSRMTLCVTGVSYTAVTEFDAEDMKAEGLDRTASFKVTVPGHELEHFAHFWNRVYAAGAIDKFAPSTTVMLVHFEVHKKNIAEMVTPRAKTRRAA